MPKGSAGHLECPVVFESFFVKKVQNNISLAHFLVSWTFTGKKLK